MTWAEAEPLGDAPPLRGPVLMQQDWRDLTFVHWAVPPEYVAALMPPGVRPDVHQGVSYVGLVAFRMVGAAPGRLAGVPWLGTFLETNVRLYSVDREGRRGVVFLSLDCDRLPVVVAARALFGVPYRWAALQHRHGPAGGDTGGDRHEYEGRLRGRRRDRAGGAAASRLVVDVGARKGPTPVDRFVSARWGLHSQVLRRGIYVPNQHAPWPLHHAEVVDLRTGGLLASVGLPGLEDREPDQVAFSPGVHTEFGLPRRRPVLVG